MGQMKGYQHYSRTAIFVSNFPYSFTNSQLEETFSDVGPIRRCFMITQKGSAKHCGFGFVHFASAEDAKQAIEQKNGSTIGGRKIVARHAMHRMPRENCSLKENEGTNDINGLKAVTDVLTQDKKLDDTKNPVKHKGAKSLCCKAYIEESFSEKQRVARTVIVGGILKADMAEVLHSLAREVGGVCSITYPLPKEDFKSHGLARDGCKEDASAVLYSSVKAAHKCVEMLHQKPINGVHVWARQLGGEGSKTQKWKVIVRNLPFQTKRSELKDIFSSAGFVWDVLIPCNLETGLSKGYAFVKFTRKQDAENAVETLNGHIFNNRPIAVDWAVPKHIYSSLSKLVESKNEQHGGNDNNKLNKATEYLDDGTCHHSPTNMQPQEVDVGLRICDMQNDDVSPYVDLHEEAEICRKVLQNIMSSSVSNEIQVEKNVDTHDSISVKIEVPANIPDETVPSEKIHIRPSGEDDELQRTVFISNLPFDINKDEVKTRFSVFGKVQSFIPVLHRVTKRSRGCGFLKFDKINAANVAIEVASATGGGSGVFLKGRQLTVLKALDKRSAHHKEMKKTQAREHDNRNLYLAKEGLILAGSPAAEGVSGADMEKRQKLEKEKDIKLQSPNFHVSRTRLIVHNLPKSMTDTELKELCISAVTSRATKQVPVIRQIKFLVNTKKNKANAIGKVRLRGVAFVEFLEHQHALAALRVLNNNPDTFSPDHRPIVGFALENIQTLRRRETKRENQQNGGVDNLQKRKRKLSNCALSEIDRSNGNGDETKGSESILDGRKAKKWKRTCSVVNDRLVDDGLLRSRNAGDDGHEVANGKKKKRGTTDKNAEIIDKKLDFLIDQYKTKLSQPCGNGREGAQQKIRRWLKS